MLPTYPCGHIQSFVNIKRKLFLLKIQWITVSYILQSFDFTKKPFLSVPVIKDNKLQADIVMTQHNSAKAPGGREGQYSTTVAPVLSYLLLVVADVRAVS